MSLVLLLRGGAGTAPKVTDSGTGTDTASLAPNILKSVSDVGLGIDNSSLVVPAPALEVLPQLQLQVSFDAPAGPIYREAVTTAPAKVYYRLNETSGQAIDTMGSFNLALFGGVTRGAATMVPGETTDKSYDFNGTTGYLRALDNALLDADEITIEAFVAADSVTGIRTIMRRVTTLDSEEDIWGLRIINGYLNLFVTDIDNVVYGYWSSKLLSIGGEYHIACTVRENQIEFYVQGVMVDFIPKSWTLMKKSLVPPPDDAPEGTQPTFITTELIVGAGFLVSNTPTEFFDGRIDEPAVYTFPLSQEAPPYHYSARVAPTSYSWTTISSDASSQMKDFSLKSGRQDIFREVETGVFTTTLENQDRAFDPTYPSSPYYPNLRPALPIRLRAVKDGITYNLFRGDVEDWPQDWKGRLNEVPLTALDALDVLSGADITVRRGVELTGDRVNAILDAAAWPVELRDIDRGSSYVQAWDSETGEAKALLQKIVLAESGHLYIDGRGFIVFRSRTTRFNSSVAVTFSNVPTGAELPITDALVVEEKDQIYNDVRITITDRDTHVAQNPQSIMQNRLRSLPLELPLEDDTEGTIKAYWLLQQYQVPFKRIKQVVIEPQQNSLMWQHALGRVIGDRVRFKIYPPGPGTFMDLQAHIEYISHKQVVGRWTTTWILSPADINQYWILGTSTLGVDTKLAY